MANRTKSKSSRSGTPDKNKMAMSAQRASKSTSRRSPQKLDDVSDAPESGEPREQGRSRGRVIDRAETGGSKSARSTTPSQPEIGRKRTSAARSAARAKGPLAAAERDESGNTRNEAWESGRQKAMED